MSYEIEAVAAALRESGIELDEEVVLVLAAKIVEGIHRQHLRLTSTAGPSLDD